MTEYSIVGVGATIVRKGEVMRERDFKGWVSNDVVIPRTDETEYADCVRDCADSGKIRHDSIWRMRIRPNDGDNDNVEDEPWVETVVDLLMLYPYFAGNSNDSACASGVHSMEINIGGKDTFDPDYYYRDGDVLSGYYREFADIAFERIGDDHGGCHFMTLWAYGDDGHYRVWGYEPDPWWEMVGIIEDSDLSLLADTIKERNHD